MSLDEVLVDPPVRIARLLDADSNRMYGGPGPTG